MLNLPFLSLLSLSLALPSPQYPSYPPPVQTTTPGFSGNGTISVRSTTLVPLGCVDANFQFIDSSDPTQCAVFSASPTSEVVPVFDVTIYGVALNSSAGCCDVGATDNSPQATRCGEESVCGSEFATDNNLIQPLYTYNRVGGDPSRDGEEQWTLLDSDGKTLQFQYGDGREVNLQWEPQQA